MGFGAQPMASAVVWTLRGRLGLADRLHLRPFALESAKSLMLHEAENAQHSESSKLL
jgi:hypothetical protein